MPDPDIAGYRYTQSGLNESHGYLLPAVFRVLDEPNELNLLPASSDYSSSALATAASPTN